jgi:hypothetical protein
VFANDFVSLFPPKSRELPTFFPTPGASEKIPAADLHIFAGEVRRPANDLRRSASPGADAKN